MAIYLVTGTPGAGKTLNTIQMVRERAIKESRSVYFANINGMTDVGDITFDNWHKMGDPRDPGVDLANDITPHSWQNAPDGSILLIDECQDYYPTISTNAVQPAYIMDYAKHRHRGFDVYLITQGPNLVNPKLKSWVSPHIHYFRAFGGNKTYRYTNEQIVNNVSSISAVSRAAVKQRVKLNSKYYGTYVSAVQHNSNRRYNLKLIALLTLPFVVVPAALWYVWNYYSGIMHEGEAPAVEVQSLGGAVGAAPGVPLKQAAMVEEKFDPVVAYAPRIEAMPETAPAYDELRKPQDFPRPQCMASKKRGCECYSQQGTLMRDYPKDLCYTYVKEGYFDATRPRRVAESNNITSKKSITKNSFDNVNIQQNQ
jgi:zonular occludens toxin